MHIQDAQTYNLLKTGIEMLGEDSQALASDLSLNLDFVTAIDEVHAFNAQITHGTVDKLLIDGKEEDIKTLHPLLRPINYGNFLYDKPLVLKKFVEGQVEITPAIESFVDEIAGLCKSLMDARPYSFQLLKLDSISDSSFIFCENMPWDIDRNNVMLKVLESILDYYAFFLFYKTTPYGQHN